ASRGAPHREQDAEPHRRYGYPCALTGVDSWSMTTFSPSSPLSFDPQHRIAPLLVVAHECDPPVPTSTASVMPDTPTGEACGAVASRSLPSPSCPRSPRPQHTTDPVFRTAHAWYLPVQIACASTLLTTVGVGFGCVLAAP